MTIEIIISGKTFDECLAIFIRRVLEETHNANTSPSVLTSSLRAISSGNDKSNSNNSDDNVQEIDLTSMKSKRFEILTILKSTIMNEGDICLEFLIKSTHKLPMYHEDSKTYLQETTGFINVKRFYKFSFKDDKNRTRCFHRYPYHSLALGVFNNMEEANTYLAAYTDHADRMRQAQKNSTDIAKKVAITTSGFYDVTANNIPTDEKNKVNLRVAYDILLNDTLILLSENAAKALENSDFVDATEQMLSIQVILYFCTSYY